MFRIFTAILIIPKMASAISQRRCGAEQLTQNSYYHYLIAKADSDTLTMVQCRHRPICFAAIRCDSYPFCTGMYQENQAAVVLFISGFVLLVLLLLLLLFLKCKDRLSFFGY